MTNLHGTANDSTDYYEREAARHEVCGTCFGTGEIGPDGASTATWEARLRPCDDCDGSGEPGRPPPTYLDGDYLRDVREEY